MLVGGHVGQLAILRKELRLARNMVSMCFRNVVHITTIMVHGRTKTPAFVTSGCPRPSSIAVLIYNGFATKWSKGVSIPIVWPIEGLARRL
jgi:hypothetical protein